MNWFVWKDNRRVGPLSAQDVGALLTSGEIGAGTAVCAEGTTVWMPLHLAAELAAFLPESARAVMAAPLPPPVGAVPPLPSTAAARASGSPVRPATTTARSFYPLAHWRGELSLPVSYWINGLLISGGVGMAAALMATTANFPSAPRLWATFGILLWVLALLASVWQIVGVWRSASRHVLRGGRPAWAMAARIAVVLGAVNLGATFAMQGVPQMTEYARMALGHDSISGYQIRLLRANSELEISGYIAFGLTDRVVPMLDAHREITLIHLNSDGGRVAEARKLRDVIAARHLSTYTSSRCLSACVVSFLAGERRLMAPTAKIGFHQYSFAGTTSAQTMAEMQKDRQYFLSRGVTPAFVQRAFQPTSALWYPSAKEMTAAHYITGYAKDDEVALSGVGAKDLGTMDATLRKDPLYAAIAEAEPETYQKIVAAVKQGFQRGETLADLRGQTIPLIQEVLLRRLPFASDAAVVAFARVMVDEIATLNRANPEKCRAFVLPGAGAADFRAELGSDLIERENETAVTVIRSAAEGRWRPPSENEIAPIRRQVIAQLALTWPGEDFDQLSHLDQPGSDPARVCRVCYGLYKAFADLPLPQAGSMLRFTFAGDRRPSSPASAGHVATESQ